MQGIPDGFATGSLALECIPLCDSFAYVPYSSSLLLAATLAQGAHQALNNSFHTSQLLSGKLDTLSDATTQVFPAFNKKACMLNWQTMLTSLLIGTTIVALKDESFSFTRMCKVTSQIYIAHKVLSKCGTIGLNSIYNKTLRND